MKTKKVILYFILATLATFVGTLAALAIAGLYAKSQLNSSVQSNPILSLL